ncbi:MAG: MFS transporter [Thermomicrobiales bacterium]
MRANVVDSKGRDQPDRTDPDPLVSPSSPLTPPEVNQGGTVFWRRNLFVAFFGVCANIIALSLVIPFLPIYVEDLGVTGHAQISQWSGLAYGITYFMAALVSPLWGILADRKGRKLILLRASFGITIVMILLSLVQNVQQLVVLRALAGILGGYAAAATILVATQAPRNRSGWALGLLSSGIMAGNLIGPVAGGALQPILGVRGTFRISAVLIFLAFVLTATLIKEEKRPPTTAESRRAMKIPWSAIPNRPLVYAMLLTAFLLLVANMSIEPILTLFIGQITHDESRIALLAGIVISTTAFGSMLAAPFIGRLGDRIGAQRVVIGSLVAGSLLLIPQAFVTNEWQLVGLRFVMGLTLAGLLPSVTSMLRLSVPDAMAGSVLGVSTSAQFAGQVAGPLVGGFVGGHFGMEWVFLITSGCLMLGAIVNLAVLRRGQPSASA